MARLAKRQSTRIDGVRRGGRLQSQCHGYINYKSPGGNAQHAVQRKQLMTR